MLWARRMGVLHGAVAGRTRTRAARGMVFFALLLVQLGLAPITSELESDEPYYSADAGPTEDPAALTEDLEGLVFTSAPHDQPSMKRHGAGAPFLYVVVRIPAPYGEPGLGVPAPRTIADAAFRRSHRQRGPPAIAA